MRDVAFGPLYTNYPVKEKKKSITNLRLKVPQFSFSPYILGINIDLLVISCRFQKWNCIVHSCQSNFSQLWIGVSTIGNKLWKSILLHVIFYISYHQTHLRLIPQMFPFSSEEQAVLASLGLFVPNYSNPCCPFKSLREWTDTSPNLHQKRHFTQEDKERIPSITGKRMKTQISTVHFDLA